MSEQHSDQDAAPHRSRYLLVEWSAEPGSLDDEAVLNRLEVLADNLMDWMVNQGGIADPSVSMGPGDEAFPAQSAESGRG